VLVNNSGIAGPTASVVDLPLAEWNRTLAINLTGAIAVRARSAAAHDGAEQRPHHQHHVDRRTHRLCAAQPLRCVEVGMIGLTRTLALEAGPYGITVNAIAPGSVRGPRLNRVMEARAKQVGVSFDEMERQFVEPTVLKKMAEEEEIAAMTLFLASDEARSITGETIEISNGARV
jgi:NAD(P)-dependent dehydrogenase (short-subunit alcohol dehydrogenase family)